MGAPAAAPRSTAAPSAAAAVRARWMCFTGGLYARGSPAPVLRYDQSSPGQQVMFMRRPPLPLLAMALALSVVALVHAADDLVLSRFSDYLDALRIQAGIPGLAAAIVGPADVTWEGAFGQQDVERNIATRLDTPFQLDGTTQAIVASLAVRCASDGWLSLDDPVSKFAPVEPRRRRDDRAAADAHDGRRRRASRSRIVPTGSRRSRRPSPAAPTRRSAGACPRCSIAWR